VPEGPDVSVVLPVFRNLVELPELTRRLAATLEGLGRRWEIVFVDDAAADGAREWIAARAAENRHLVLVANECNLGQHASIVRGLATARGRLTVVMDADLQDAPEDVPTLLAAWRPGIGAVFARRSVPYQEAGRHWSGRMFKRLLRRLSGARLPIGVGSFFVVDATVRDKVVAVAGARPYVPLLVALAGEPIECVEIEKRARAAGGSAYTFRARARLALDALRDVAARRSRQR